MNIKDILSLEETISSDRIREWIRFLIEGQFPYEEKLLVFDALFELSDKQWHNYELLEASTQEKLENWLINHINLFDIKIVHSILGITARLGLKKFFLELVQIAETDTVIPEEIRSALKDGIEELKDCIDNPWLGME